jgi:hypothetical protein
MRDAIGHNSFNSHLRKSNCTANKKEKKEIEKTDKVSGLEIIHKWSKDSTKLNPKTGMTKSEKILFAGSALFEFRLMASESRLRIYSN